MDGCLSCDFQSFRDTFSFNRRFRSWIPSELRDVGRHRKSRETFAVEVTQTHMHSLMRRYRKRLTAKRRHGFTNHTLEKCYTKRPDGVRHLSQDLCRCVRMLCFESTPQIQPTSWLSMVERLLGLLLVAPGLLFTPVSLEPKLCFKKSPSLT